MALVAKPITKNKFWIVEEDGNKVATIQTTPSGVSFVKNEKRENFVSINLLRDKYNISFEKSKRLKSMSVTHDVSGYPCDHKPLNALYNVTMKLPVYTKTLKSKSFYCAGYYLVQYGHEYIIEFCPKLITLNRYEYCGPFTTKTQAKEFFKALR